MVTIYSGAARPKELRISEVPFQFCNFFLSLAANYIMLTNITIKNIKLHKRETSTLIEKNNFLEKK